MKYFAKYLPVEGEIKEGEKYLNSYDGKIWEYREAPCPMPYWGNKKTLSCYKLFLCSYDKQVGDKVYSIYDLSEELAWTQTEENWDTEDKKDGTFKPNLYFKVIGEISPDATWVKDGDKFNEDQIAVLRTHDTEFTSYSSELKQHQIGFVAIKGQCNHFH